MSGHAAVAQIQHRVQALQQRFAPPPSQTFDAALAHAATTMTTLAPSARTPSAPPAAATSPASPSAARSLRNTWSDALPAAGRAWAPAIEQAALRNGIDPALLASLVWTESGFDSRAVSHAGAVGLAQLMPATADGLGVDPHDPHANLDGGARFLRAQLDRFGSRELALAAYNAGPARVAEAGGVPAIEETQAYVPAVLRRYTTLRGAT